MNNTCRLLENLVKIKIVINNSIKIVSLILCCWFDGLSVSEENLANLNYVYYFMLRVLEACEKAKRETEKVLTN